jgi:hypothetical protein
MYGKIALLTHQSVLTEVHHNRRDESTSKTEYTLIKHTHMPVKHRYLALNQRMQEADLYTPIIVTSAEQEVIHGEGAGMTSPTPTALKKRRQRFRDELQLSVTVKQVVHNYSGSWDEFIVLLYKVPNKPEELCVQQDSDAQKSTNEHSKTYCPRRQKKQFQQRFESMTKNLYAEALPLTILFHRGREVEARPIKPAAPIEKST